MIGRGKYHGIFLYEITEQDLLYCSWENTDYHAGNILLFPTKQGIGLGHESACAKDLLSARERLDQSRYGDTQAQEPLDQAVTDLRAQIAKKDIQVNELETRIAQRDELLRDFALNLDAQQQDNELLHTQLVKAHEQLAVEELKYSELIDDLQFASSETYTIESTLGCVMEEKSRLEQELAERITELIELDLQNGDLRRQLHEPNDQEGSKPSGTGQHKTTQASQVECAEPETQLPSVATEKRIHVLHEFPATPKRPLLQRLAHNSLVLLRTCAVAVAALLLLGAVSVIATAHINGISYGDACDLVLRGLGITTLLL